MLKLFACHRSKPSDYQKEVNSTSETALQRAIFNNGKTTIDLGEIEWLDLELPVDLERGGRGHCPDLLGKIGSRMVICELKFNTHSNNMKPQDAEIEVQGYYKKIVENHVELDRFGNLHRANCKSFNWSDFAKDDVIRIIAADQNYWDYWINHRKVSLPQNTPCYSIAVTPNYFKNQKHLSAGKYVPTMAQ